MYALVGTRYVYDCDSCQHSGRDESETVAVFSTYEAAVLYLDRARLAAARRPHFRPGRGEAVFASKSLLSLWQYAEIEQYDEPIPPPVDPEPMTLRGRRRRSQD